MIKQINDYFVNKLLDEDFKIIEVREFTVELTIDDKYHFSLWIANGAKYFEVNSNRRSFMHLSFDDTQKQYLHKYFNDIKKGIERDRLLKEKERIESELKNL